MKLNLGCGTQFIEGFENIDPFIDGAQHLDILNLPYEPDTVDEILVDNVLEHLYSWEVPLALQHWHKLLKKEGTLILIVPDFETIIRKMNTIEDMIRYIFGDQSERRQEQVHRWAYTKANLNMLLMENGFNASSIHNKPRIYDLKIIAEKV